jgi:hypothetical protein
LSRWIVEIQSYDLDVLNEHNDEELMEALVTLIWDTMVKDIVLCHRCLETVFSLSEEVMRMEDEPHREEPDSET